MFLYTRAICSFEVGFREDNNLVRLPWGSQFDCRAFLEILGSHLGTHCQKQRSTG